MAFKWLIQGKDGNWIDVIKKKFDSKEYVYLLAVAHAIDIIAKTVAKTEIQVFKKNKKENKIEEVVDELYWRLNVQPNLNENGFYFKYKLVCQLLLEQKAIVLLNELQKSKEAPYMYVADSYETDNKILYGKTYKNITVSDDEGNSLKLDKIYNSDEILKFSFHNPKMKQATELYKNELSKILKVASKKYIRANNEKWRLKSPGSQPKLMDMETGKEISRDEYKKKVTEGLLDDEDAILLISEQFGLENLNNKERTTDFNDFVGVEKDICDKAAMIFNIPLDIFYGSKTEKSTGTNDFVTFAVDPVFMSLENGYTIGLIGEKDFIKGENLLFNRFTIGHQDITDMASGLDKLKGIGYSHNDINKFIKLPKVDEEWANEHYVTKNYGNVRGGEEGNG